MHELDKYNNYGKVFLITNEFFSRKDFANYLKKEYPKIKETAITKVLKFLMDRNLICPTGRQKSTHHFMTI